MSNERMIKNVEGTWNFPEGTEENQATFLSGSARWGGQDLLPGSPKYEAEFYDITKSHIGSDDCERRILNYVEVVVA
jgi:hypothetical protein